jgi:uncharacterized membrane protein YjfL (UPF0719 family)
MPGPCSLHKPFRADNVPPVEPSTPYLAAFGSATVLILLVVHRVVQRLISPKSSLRAELLGDNRAFALREVGDVLAVFLLGAAVTKNCVHGEDIILDIQWATAFGLLGLGLIEGAGILGLRLLMQKRLTGALEKGNIAAGTAAAAHYVAVGFLTSRAMAGSDYRGLALSLAFFAIGVLTHQMMVALFRFLTTYDDTEQIEGENLAAALSYGGVSIAVAIVVGRAIEGGDFVDWTTAITGFAMVAVTALAIVPVRQIVVQGVLLGGRPTLRGGELDEAIGRDRNIGAAALEATTYLGAALALSLLA